MARVVLSSGILLAALGAVAAPPVAIAAPGASASQGQFRICPKCGAKFPASNNFCERDGTPLPALKTAPSLRPPASFSADTTQAAQVRLSWQPGGPGVREYRVYRGVGGGRPSLLSRVSAASPRFVDTNVSSSQRYAYYVEAVGVSGATANSATVAVTVRAAPPRAPEVPSVRAVSSSRVELSWKASREPVTGYEIERWNGSAFRRIGAVPSAATHYADAGLKPHTTYAYRVRAVGIGGTSQPSREARALTLEDGPVAPSDLAVVPVSQTQLRVTWVDRASDETGFAVERKAPGETFRSVAELDADATSFVDNGLAPGQAYTYRVRAAGKSASSSFSPEITAVTRRDGAEAVSAEPRDAALRLVASPNRVTLVPGQRSAVEFRFGYPAQQGAELVARWTRLTTLDGRPVAERVGPFAVHEALPPTGPGAVRAEVQLPTGAFNRLRDLGQKEALLQEYFEGRRDDRTRVVWSTAVVVELASVASGAQDAVVESDPAVHPATNPVDHADLVWIDAGGFRMGSDVPGLNAGPEHSVALAHGFSIYRSEVTNAQYRQFVEATGWREPDLWEDPRFNAADQPVVGVSWEDGAEYARWAGGRLPTEAEWEYAARGRDDRTYPWGLQAPDAVRAVFSARRPGRAGERKSGGSPFGVLDLAGNVAEWCADWFDPAYYQGSPVAAPSGPPAGTARVVRGGSWKDSAAALSSLARSGLKPDSRLDTVGFRVVIDRR